MKTALECIPCFVRQAAEAVAMAVADHPLRERILRRLLHELAGVDWDVSPVAISQRLHRLIRAETGQADPYRALKDQMNRIALELLPVLTDLASRHPNPREAVVRLAIAGNMLDAGSKSRLAPEDLPARLGAIWYVPLAGDVAGLFDAADRARRILFLADNAGEIVFDRLLIEALPAGRVTVAVRGSPVLNDATLDDAETAGITRIAPVMTNGSDAPGTLVQECSEEFRDCFDRADLIVAKGQGNYETLSETTRDIFFLFAVKCPLIAANVGAPLGALVVKHGQGHAARTPAVDVLVIGTEPPCPRCDRLVQLAEGIAAENAPRIHVRHAAFTSPESIELGLRLHRTIGTAKAVAETSGIHMDWDAVHELIDRKQRMLAGNSRPADAWTPELDELLRPCQEKADSVGYLMTPVLLINGAVRHHGSVPTRQVIDTWLREARNAMGK